VTADPGTVLALRALGLGDALTGVPALRGLRRRWPAARLVLAAPAAVGGWLRDLGVVDEVLDSAPLQPLHWHGSAPDVAVNLHGRGPQSHRLLAALRPREIVAFACSDAGCTTGPRWRADEHEVTRWCRLVGSVGASCGPEDLWLPGPTPRGEHVVVHPGAAFPARRWPAERWAHVVRALRAHGTPVVVTGTMAEADLCARVAVAGAADAAGRFDLPDLARTVGTARLLLSGDTGVAHLATAYRTPSVVLFGPTPPALWGPAVDSDLHTVIWHDRDDDPPGDPHATRPDPRLLRVTVEDVLTPALEVSRL
jgi:ADP-heptose:LPS heptosyltransferase